MQMDCDTSLKVLWLGWNTCFFWCIHFFVDLHPPYQAILHPCLTLCKAGFTRFRAVVRHQSGGIEVDQQAFIQDLSSDVAVRCLDFQETNIFFRPQTGFPEAKVDQADDYLGEKKCSSRDMSPTVPSYCSTMDVIILWNLQAHNVVQNPRPHRTQQTSKSIKKHIISGY